MFPSFETGLTKKLSKMGVEHFVASPTKPDAYRNTDENRKKYIRTQGQKDRATERGKRQNT